MLAKFSQVLLTTTLLYSSCFALNVVAKNPDKVIATYNQGEIKISDIMKQLKPLFDNDPNLKGKDFNSLPHEMQVALLKRHIDKILIDTEVQKSKIQNSPKFKDQLDNLKSQLAQSYFIDEMLKSKVTDVEVEKQVSKIKEELKDKEEVKIKHILLKTKKEAEDVKKKIQKGEKFDALAKKLSTDNNSKDSGGELGYLTKEVLEPDFADKVFAMKKGEISSPFKTSFGWHIVQMIDKRKVSPPNQEQLKEAAKSRLSHKVFGQYIDDLNSKAGVKILIEGDEGSSVTNTKDS